MQQMTAIYFHPKVREWVEGRAKLNNESMNALVRRLVRAYIKATDRPAWDTIERAIMDEIITSGRTATGG
jgi:hypothetical protein